jgi:hypothetical protein
MGLLRAGVALVAASAAGCYEPELRDCTLTCSEASDCAGGQVCGSDHFCAAPAIAGRCSSLPGDAGSNGRDGGVDPPKMDARVDAPPDAPTHVTLTISIEGQGIGTCDEAAPQNGQCAFDVPINALVTVQAQSYSDWHFEKWTTVACITVPIASCTFYASVSTPVGVKFKKD